MESREQQLMTLLGLTARALTDMTASVTAFSFELLRSEDPLTRAAARKMIDRMMTLSAGLDEHWRLLAELSGVHAEQGPMDASSRISMEGPPRLPPN
ncbi:uncharacterized protein POS17_4838 [Pseudomonas sp. Os17]|uniref:Uncharacterized protein n=1 Tax=Pseudomonas protegens TaxID=380021 RepID=A0A2T6GIQ1_9PSED|nr:MULTISPECIES: hypothetical protein [Pseudomonas]PUA44025.1 hypothetical protein C5U62_18850 [Pseudomonas protegens]RXU62703.1 hypothetical protein CW358_21770 [Pseudomonas protegens]ULT72066.1 hypothetical protein L1O02_06790 [Pseudomonas sp. BC42]BAQ76532.1 uncharacterized protein POS17_4838 [Pseudomonas sp. Os17]